MSEMKSLQLYGMLIGKLDAHEEKLLRKYSEHIACEKGCASCCILETVFPVDAFLIYSTVASGRISPESLIFEPTEGRCVFLKDGLCSVYSARPVICRTHGYPVIVDGKVDFCPENFKNIKSIDSENILDLENLNRALASINIIFQRETENNFFQKDRIILKELKEYIFKIFNFQRSEPGDTDTVC